MNRACKDCEWYAPLLSGVGVYSETSGRCHRCVPDAENYWPYVSAEDWCGEFQPCDAGPKLARTDPLDSVRVRQLSRCFAELAHVVDVAGTAKWAVMRAQQILVDVTKIIDLPAAVEAWKKEQE
ncbi:MAG: hypothetical protein WC565_10600 [Parcubacteria group bacterium]